MFQSFCNKRNFCHFVVAFGKCLVRDRVYFIDTWFALRPNEGLLDLLGYIATGKLCFINRSLGSEVFFFV